MRTLPPASLIGLALLLPATGIAAGWLLREPAIVGALPGATMVFNTALCLALAGLALACEGLAPQKRDRAQAALGCATAAIAAIVLAEHATGMAPGIDWPALHAWFAAVRHPGRMSPPTALAFLAGGTCLATMHRVRRLWQGIGVQLLTAGTIAGGCIGIVGHVLQLPLVYRNYALGQMALASAVGLIAAGAGMGLAWRRDPWYCSRTLIKRPADRIALGGALVLAIIVAGSVLIGFAVMQRHADQLARSDRLLLLESRAAFFKVTVDLRTTRAALVSTRPNLTEQLDKLNREPDNAEALLRLRSAAASFLPWGFSALAFSDLHGRQHASAGHFVADSAIRIALRSTYPATLVWQNGYVLRVSMPMLRDGATVGFMAAEQPLAALSGSMQSQDAGLESAETAVCARSGDVFDCFPQRFVPRPFSLPYSAALPMARAVAGETGTLVARDYRGENVLAAHGPIGQLGLGMVVKIDTAELYAPLRESLYTVLLLLAFMLGAGVWLLYRNVTPLARELASSQERLELALEGSGLALWDWDVRAGRVILSEQWESMLGRPARATAVPIAELQALVPQEDAQPLADQLRQVLRGTKSRYDIEHRVRIESGGWKWIRSRGQIVERGRDGLALRLVGTNSDITARKEAQLSMAHRASHDALTGLPGRSLFADRLDQAVARARRNKTPMALVYLDIDKFKAVNDSMGHDTGDRLLTEFSRRLADCVRNTDTAARLGGDEFVVILEALAGREDGERIAEKIVAAMRPEFRLGERTLCITTSAGIAFLGPDDDLDGDALLKKADEALYKAKAAGRDNYQVAA